jgi:macrolide transport system ATP-binding/permease protein
MSLDLRYALRRLLRTPGFTLVAILSLALGIGANSAIFSIVNAFLFRSLHVRAPEQLVEIYTSDDNGFQYSTSSYLDYISLRDATRAVFEDVIAYELVIAQNNQGDSAPLVMGETVTGNYFRALGVQPVLGRGFLPEEDATPGTHPVVVLGYGYWQRVFAGARDVLGKTVLLNRRPYTVVGVAPREFRGTYPGLEAQLFVPMMMSNVVHPGSLDRLNTRGSRSLLLKGRLQQGVTVERARSAVEAVSRRLSVEFPRSNDKRIMHVLPTTDVSIHPAVDKALVPVAALLLTVVGLVLLIACANLASFLLARGAERRKEIALRLALGAGRARLVRQLLVESTVLALIGGVAGLGLAWLIVRALVSFQPPLPIPIDLVIELDRHVLLFTTVVSILAGIAFGLAPALNASNPQLAPTLRDEAANVTGSRRRVTLRNLLVAGQVAVSLVLLIGSGLFLRSLQKAQRIDPGFYTGPAAILWPNMEMSGYDETRGRQLQERLYEQLARQPGVTRVTMADRLPLGAAVQTMALRVAGVQPPPGQESLDVDFTHADENYFAALDVPIVAGRAFNTSDRAGTPTVVVVSEAAARAYWPKADPIGQTIHLGRTGNDARVIGVARDTKVRTLGEKPRPYLYLNSRQEYVPSMLVIVRGQGSAEQLLRDAQRVALELDPQLVLFQTQTMEQHLGLMLFAPRMAALLLSVFGGLALLLAAVGVYGVVSYTVARRTREVGIRMALGADSRDVIKLMIGGGMKLVASGAVTGVLLAAAVTWPLARFLYGIRTSDLLTFVIIPALLVIVGFAACYLPARKASRTSPVQALVD